MPRRFKRVETLEEFLDDLASDQPVPAGASASALAASSAAALVAMCCRLTIGRDRYKDHHDTMVSVLEAAERLRTDTLHLAFEDVETYTAVSRARSLPRETDEQRETRTTAIQEALRGATRSPLQIARQSSRVLINCRSIVDGVNPHTLSDLAVAALLARAGLDGAILSARTNLALIKDDAFNEAASAELGHIESSRAIVDEVLRTAESRK